MSPLVSLRNLTKRFQTGSGTVHAVEDVSLDIPKGAIMGLVGESGSGKTTLGRTLLRLVEPTSGQVIFDGQDITALPPREMREMRRRMQIIFQDPVSSLNPRLKVGDLVAEGLKAFDIGTRRERRDRVAALLEEVGLSPDHMDRYPHAFSGGQRQRIGLARTLALEPEFIVADESVSALDVSIQAQVLNLLLDLREKRNLTMLFIAHDLSVVNYLCDQVAVMYLGRLMEVGPVTDVHRASGHPYTRALNSAIPLPDPRAPRDRVALQGDIPSPLSPPSGCVFRTRCAFAEESCARGTPEAHALAPDHLTYCKIPEVRHVQ
ncbi:peptide ABC transporter ATP-binding protein (plasmid) [Sagittula sp. P11]|jgi:oligopeptide/dipeptide ABC transporter ATP-binding protein|uniref:ABC transporter ATP-binding protein n=1 Tax=unclassified Sagittula TaxID=2624628 RepID=UPI000C2D13EC|nr:MULTISPECIES: ABC transporter ATP-binding protein [unclassified Sagittula]AUC56732.1 peptide ABC transporter ATP-binding protein [Sagittula sp. P11]WHZ37775.1 ABC transporter ATP-binding protein [Sagittula sp. MA-2]